LPFVNEKIKQTASITTCRSLSYGAGNVPWQGSALPLSHSRIK